MIGEQLDGHGVDERRDERVNFRHLDSRDAALACFLQALALDPKNAETQQVNAFLAKPITPESLLACLRQVCV
jgi:hypothetical protein